MQCERFERRLHQLLDERSRPEADPQLVAHAHACAACGAALDAQRMLFSVLARAEAPQPSAGFAAAVVRGALQATAASPRPEPLRALRARGRKQFVLAAGIAAALLLAVTPALLRTLRGPQVNDSTGSLTQLPTESPATAVAGENAAPFENPSLAQVAAENSPSAIASADETLQGPAADREEHYAQILDRWRTQLPELGNTLGLTDANAPTKQGAEAVSEITARLRSPVSASIESTLNVLRTALPAANAEQDPAKPQAGVFGGRASALS
jgi:hypothetical protein